jgi:hypothetical protein
MQKSNKKSADQLLEDDIQHHIDNYILSHKPEYIDPIFKHYKLTEYLTYFRQYTLHQTQGYHNQCHSYSVALNCYEGAMNTALLTSNDRVAILLAGLFHDYQHTQNLDLCHKEDSVNIRIAVNGFLEIHSKVKQPVDDVICKKVVYLIQTTEYPYKTNSIKLRCPLAKIIRDADLMNIYEEPEVALQQLYGLYKEKLNGIPFSQIGNTPTTRDWFKANVVFLKSVNFISQWAKLKAFKRNYPARIAEVQQLFNKTF